MTGCRQSAAALAALLAVLPFAAASADPAPVAVEFSAPARMGGALDSAAGQWALLVFREAPGDAFPLALGAGGSVVHHVTVQVDAGAAAVPPYGGALPARQVGAVDGQLVLGGGAWASLYVRADRVELSAERLDGTLVPAAGGDAVDSYLARAPRGTAVRPSGQQVPEDGAALSLQGGEAPFRVSLRATGVRLVEWHNATMECGGSPCAGFESPAPAMPALPGARTLEYVEVLAPGGDLEATSAAVLAVAGGAALDLAVNGTARLPQAAVSGDCGGARCPDPAGATLQAAGLLRLDGVRPAEGGRLQASLSGPFDARIDEQAAPALGRGAAAAAAAVAAAVAVPLLVKVALALFARSARPPALRHPKRRQLYELIRAEPGQSFRGLQRRTGWQNGTLSNHVARLLDAHLVVSRPYRNTVRYFGSDTCPDGAWTATVVLANADLRKLHGWLLAHPASPQAAVVEQGRSAWGWPRTTTQERLRTLLEGKLAEARRHGRKVLYSALPVPAVGPASPWMPRHPTGGVSNGLSLASAGGTPAASLPGPGRAFPSAAQSATVSPSSTGGSFLATSHTPANTRTAAGTTFH